MNTQKKYWAYILSLFVVMAGLYLTVTIFETPSYKYYVQQVQVIRDGYPISDYPVVTYLLHYVSLVTGDISTGVRVITIFCMFASMILILKVITDKPEFWWLVFIIPFNPFTYMMVEAALLRNIVAFPLLALLMLNMKQLDMEQSGLNISKTLATLLLLYCVHNLSVVLGAGMVCLYLLLSHIDIKIKVGSILVGMSLVIIVLFESRFTVLPWMLGNMWVNWPRIFETVTYVPVATSFFIFLLSLLYSKHLHVRTLSMIGLLLHLGTWIAPQGIGLRLLYYTPVLLPVALYSNIKTRNYVGLQLFSVVLSIAHFLALLISLTR